MKNLKKLEDSVDFSSLNENLEILSSKNRKLLEKLKQKLIKTFGLLNLFV